MKGVFLDFKLRESKKVGLKILEKSYGSKSYRGLSKANIFIYTYIGKVSLRDTDYFIKKQNEKFSFCVLRSKVLWSCEKNDSHAISRL